MNILNLLIESLTSELFTGAVLLAIARGVWRAARFIRDLRLGNPIIGLFKYLPSRRIVRFSATALLYVEHPEEAARYLLYKEDNRPDRYWAPIGGVLKYSPDFKQSYFKKFEIQELPPGEKVATESRNDVRLFFPGWKTISFLRRFLRLIASQQGIENPLAAIHREMIEEVIDDAHDPSAMRSTLSKTAANSPFDLGKVHLRLKEQFPIVFFKLDQEQPTRLVHLRLFYIVESVDYELPHALLRASKLDSSRFFWATQDQIEQGHSCIEQDFVISDHSKAIFSQGLSKHDTLNHQGLLPQEFQRRQRRT